MDIRSDKNGARKIYREEAKNTRGKQRYSDLKKRVIEKKGKGVRRGRERVREQKKEEEKSKIHKQLECFQAM